eukprot:9489348-Pyramimonas_sp.AAC.1
MHPIKADARRRDISQTWVQRYVSGVEVPSIVLRGGRALPLRKLPPLKLIPIGPNSFQDRDDCRVAASADLGRIHARVRRKDTRCIIRKVIKPSIQDVAT